MRPWRKIGLSARLRTPNALCTTLCQVLMLLVSSQWCLGGFTPNWAWGEESSAQTTANKASSSDEEYSFWRPSPDWSTRFFPTPQEIQRYRKSWNPFSHGPILTNAADVSPKGQFLAQLYVFSQVGNSQYGNSVTLGHHDSSVHLRAVAPTFFFGYGVTDNLELNVAPQLLWYNSFKGTGPSLAGGQGSGHANDIGLGDTTLFLKWRLRVQDPDSWHGTWTLYNGVSLPTSQWFGTDTFGTHPVPGGFAPLGRLPATRFGGLAFTEGLMWRKNIQPFRLMGAVYYTYTIPGSTGGRTTYNGDIINTRAIAEWIVDDKRGFGLALEFLSIHGVPWRADGHGLNINPASYHLIGLEPSIQYTLFHGPGGSLVAAAGCLFSIAGQNDINAIYPNMSIYYYWNKEGTALMR